MTATPTRSLVRPRPEVALRRVATLMLIVAAALVVASGIHLFGHVTGRSDLYDASDAGIAEGIIAVVLVGGALAVRRDPAGGRVAGVAAVAFAVLGYAVGLSMTARAGHWPDIVFHLAGLPVLLWCLAELVRRRPHRVSV